MIISPIRALTAALKDIAEGEGDLTVRLNDTAKTRWPKLQVVQRLPRKAPGTHAFCDRQRG
jgi:hypothetical protein